STMEPKNYSTIRSILKKAQGEKIAPYVFKINDTQMLQQYLDKEKITYEIYQEERKIITTKRTLIPTQNEPRKKRKLET
ncbi:19029_t:CDS:1, partial [Dentiscutata erythropus]